MTTSATLDYWRSIASAAPSRIVLADGADARVQAAARVLSAEKLADPVLIGRDIMTLADVGDLAVDQAAADAVAYAASIDREIDLDDPYVIGAILVRAGWAAGCVAGAIRPTSDVLRAGLRVLGVDESVGLLSSSFLMVLPDGSPLAYGDCGVNPDPDAEQLARIAISTSATFRQLTGQEPRTAMLSFSTKASASHGRVDKVQAATALARELEPSLAIDGELQFDAAWVPSIAEQKAPESAVAGRANVFIFPDLDSGNIAYKITERLGQALAFGPLLQGLTGVLHDLSRGCSVDDVINVTLIASVQAGADA